MCSNKWLVRYLHVRSIVLKMLLILTSSPSRDRGLWVGMHDVYANPKGNFDAKYECFLTCGY